MSLEGGGRGEGGGGYIDSVAKRWATGSGTTSVI